MTEDNDEIIAECLDNWDWEENVGEVNDIQEEIELAARQVLDMALQEDPDLANIAGKLNRIEAIAAGRVNW